MRRKSSASLKEAYARDSVVRTAIGRMLCAHYDLAAPLPARLEQLLRQFEDENAAMEPQRSSGPRAALGRNSHPK
jgi:hypothetical protein